MEIKEVAYDDPDVVALVDAVQAEYAVRYGGSGDTSPVDSREFGPPHGRFFVGYLDSRPVAMGGLRRHTEDDAVEIKRMYVVPDCRGQGLSRQMLAALEYAARELGATRVVLETGQRQPEAMRLYETAGYERIEGFGYYKDAPLSVSYGKALRAEI